MAICPTCHVDHRGLCHHCVHNGKVGGDYRNSPCARCRPAEALQQGHGRNVSYDELAAVLGDRPTENQEDAAQLDLALEALRAVIGLDAVGREIVFRYLADPGTTLQAVASYLSKTFRRPFTLQAVHWRIRVMQKKGRPFTDLLQGSIGSPRLNLLPRRYVTRPKRRLSQW